MKMRRSDAEVPQAPQQVVGGVNLQRRQITVAAALALLGGASITLTGCSGGSSPAQPSAPSQPTSSSCPPDAACGNVEGDPNHSAIIGGPSSRREAPWSWTSRATPPTGTPSS